MDCLEVENAVYLCFLDVVNPLTNGCPAVVPPSGVFVFPPPPSPVSPSWRAGFTYQRSEPARFRPSYHHRAKPSVGQSFHQRKSTVPLPAADLHQRLQRWCSTLMNVCEGLRSQHNQYTFYAAACRLFRLFSVASLRSLHHFDRFAS